MVLILKPGVLLKLVEEMKTVKDSSSASPNNNHKPTLLQVRSIVPIMEEGDLWPNKGFHIKVCDSSHAMYVSLPQEMDDLILGDNIKLGQFIYVEKMELSHPVPTLIGVTLLTDCQPCMGSPEEIDFSLSNERDLVNETKTESTSEEEKEKNGNLDPIGSNQVDQNCIEKQCVVEMKVYAEDHTGLRRSNSNPTEDHIGLRRSNSIPTEDQTGLRRSNSNPTEDHIGLRRSNSIPTEDQTGLRRSNSIPIEKESDSDSPKCSSSSRRRSWGGVPKGASPKPIAPKPRRSRSAGASPVRASRNDDTDDNSTLVKLRARKTITKSTHNKSRDHTPRRICESQTCSKGRRNNQTIQVQLSKPEESWDNLPPDLLKLGKEVIKNRDTSLFVAIEALQEAAVAEKLLKCLNTFSDIHEEKKDYDHRPLIERFLNLQNDLMQSKLILESLTNISPLKTSSTDHGLTVGSSVKKALSLAIERKKNAASWINAATASDIPPFSNLSMPVTTEETSKRSKKSSKGSRNNYSYIPKTKVIGFKMQEKVSENIPPIDKENNTSCSTRESAMSSMIDLVDSLLNECSKWFLPHIEKILDEYPKKSYAKEHQKEVAEMMQQIKRVNDWLDMIVNKERISMQNHDTNVSSSTDEPDEQCVETPSNVIEDSIVEACERVKCKIYKVLLEHVHKNAVRTF